MRPASGASRPEIRFTSVVLPAPLGPMSAWISPGPHRQAHMVRGQQAAKALDQPLHLKKADGSARPDRSLSAASPLGA